MTQIASSICFRALTAHDITAYRSMMLQAYQQDSEVFISSVAERSAMPDAWWLQRIAASNGSSTAFGIFVAGELIAALVLERSQRPKTQHKAQINAVYVRPAWRGQGIAGQLLQASLQVARQQGVEQISLSVLESNPGAKRLYQRLGFIEYGCEPMAVKHQHAYLSKYLLWQSLI